MKNFQIAGRLGSTPELQEKNETTWTQLRIAVNGKHTDWFTIAAFGTLAENCCKHLNKGDGVAVTGRLRTGSYEGREIVQLVAEAAQFFPHAAASAKG